MPVGTILPYVGDIAKIPYGWYLCDGKNNTPDLSGRTLVGTGIFNDIYGSITYNLGNTGGERYHQLTIAEMPSHRHYGDAPFNRAGFDASGPDNGAGSTGYPVRIALGDNPPYYNAEYTFMTALTGGNQPHNIMQPYMTVYWIIRIR